MSQSHEHVDDADFFHSGCILQDMTRLDFMLANHRPIDADVHARLKGLHRELKAAHSALNASRFERGVQIFQGDLD